MVSTDFHTHSRVSFQPINTRQQAVRMASCSWCSTQLGFPRDTSRTRPAASWEEQCRRAWAALSRSSSELTKLALSQAIPALRALRITAIIAAPLELWEGSMHCSHPMLLLCKRLAPFSNAEENKPRVCLLWSFFFFFFWSPNNHLAPYFEIHRPTAAGSLPISAELFHVSLQQL